MDAPIQPKPLKPRARLGGGIWVCWCDRVIDLGPTLADAYQRWSATRERLLCREADNADRPSN